MSILVVGLSHRSAPVEVLERITLGVGDLDKVLADIHDAAHVSEAVLISTCNRLELYADVTTFHGGVDDVSSIVSDHTGTPRKALTPYLYVHYEERAVQHLFTVAGGLDSMVVGETQILGQVREAYRTARESGAAGRVLTEVFQNAIRVARRAHAETGIHAAGRSLVTVGLAAVAPATATGPFEDGPTERPDGRSWRDSVAGRRAVVVGAGSMAALAATTLSRAGADVVVVNRTLDKANHLASAVGGTAVPLADLEETLTGADLVVSCTGATEVVLPYDLLATVTARRYGRPLGIVDLALPHDVDPAAAELPGVELADLATLAESRDADGGAVAEDVESARSIVDDEVAAFSAARRAAEVAPTIVALRSMGDTVISAELTRLRGKLPHLDDRAREEVATTVRRVVDKLLHSPTVRVKELAASPDGASYAAALRELFSIDPRVVEAVARPSGDLNDGEGDA